MPEAWHVAICDRARVMDAARAIGNLSCISEVCAPFTTVKLVRRGRALEVVRPWLGPMVLARWPGADPFAWHDVMDTVYVADILGGWMPATVPDASVTQFLKAIDDLQNISTAEQVPPCAPGDAVRFSHLNIFYRVIGHCIWIAAGLVGIRVSLLGRETIISVPYAGIEETIRPVGKQRRRARQFGK